MMLWHSMHDLASPQGMVRDTDRRIPHPRLMPSPADSTWMTRSFLADPSLFVFRLRVVPIHWSRVTFIVCDDATCPLLTRISGRDAVPSSNRTRQPAERAVELVLISAEGVALHTTIPSSISSRRSGKADGQVCWRKVKSDLPVFAW